ncbi:MAG: hypothetical protein ABH860_06305 [bacterium]
MFDRGFNVNDLDLLKRDLLFETQRCVELFNSQIFIKHQTFTQSAFVEILIRLDYILQKLRKKNNGIIWTDDVQVDQKIKDVTGLVNNLRNAACHCDSPRNYISNLNVKFVFNVFVGKCSSAVKTGENILLGNEYQDDIAFYYGDKRVYLVRHIKRLLEELPNKINELK